MGYIDTNLLPDETVVHRATLHWLIFGKAIAVAALGVILLTIEPTIGAIVVAIGVAMSLPPLIAYKTSEFGVTSKRVIVKVGLVQRQTLELLAAAGGAPISVDTESSWAAFSTTVR